MPYTTLTVWLLQPRQKVFTARYGLSPYTTHTRFVFKSNKLRVSTYYGKTAGVLAVPKYNISTRQQGARGSAVG